MGRKKARRTTGGKKKSYKTMEKKFNCPLCNHENVVHCKTNKKDMEGNTKCAVCSSIYSCPINKLDQEIDVYNKWIDSMR